jgi:hypothetical protein
MEVEGSITDILSRGEEDAAVTLLSLRNLPSSINNDNTCSFPLSNNNRRNLLSNYNNLIKAGVEKSNATAEVGYTL